MRVNRVTARQWLLAVVVCIGITNAQEDSAFPSPATTLQPETFRTGRINQFQGFFTPKPYPSNANFVYASIWASWSAWSFCSSNVQVRVRACNTVRGFTCPGANQERRSCGNSQNRFNQLNSQAKPLRRFGGDYDAVDPWEEDRKEALRQLYSDYSPSDDLTSAPQQKPRVPAKIATNTGREFVAVARSAGKTAQGLYNGQPLGPPIEDFGRQLHSTGPGGAPSMTPERLFGSKLEVPTKNIASNLNSFESKESHPNNNQALESIESESHSNENLETAKPQTQVEHTVSTVESTGSPLRIIPANAFVANVAKETTTTPQPEQLNKHDEADKSETVENTQNSSKDNSELKINHVVTSTEAPSTTDPLNLEVISEDESHQTSENDKPEVVTPTKTVSSVQLNENQQLPEDFVDEKLIVPGSGELYDDEVEQKKKAQQAAQQALTAKNNNKKIVIEEKQSSTNIQEIEELEHSTFEDVLHDGEVVLNKDTANALEWLLANMTKAAQSAAQNAHAAKFFPGEKDEENSVLDAEQQYKTNLHSGEVNYETKQNSGEVEGFIGVNKVVHRVHGVKTQQKFVEEKPVTIKKLLPNLPPTNGIDYRKAKIIKPAQYQIRPDVETLRLESELRKLHSDMEKMESDLKTTQSNNEQDLNIGAGPRQIFELTEEFRPLATAFNPRLRMHTLPKSRNAAVNSLRIPLPVSQSSNVHYINVNGSGVRIVDSPLYKPAHYSKGSGVSKPVNSKWSDWSRWGICQDGSRIRTRQCVVVNNVACDGPESETQKCFSFTQSNIAFAKDPLVIEKEILGTDNN